MTSFVFDTGVLSLFYADDDRLRPVVDKIHGKRAQGLLSSVTLAEFYYKTCQSLGRDVATLWSHQLNERLQVVGADLDLSISAGLEKCRNNRLSLADSYALALAKRVSGVLLTTDSELGKSKESTVRFFEV
ncbi:MAG: PIN domain-containing protein [Nitrososphaerales archaeon]|nr:PIN domain-containing protein [Nitrososphaerales archaeon]